MSKTNDVLARAMAKPDHAKFHAQACRSFAMGGEADRGCETVHRRGFRTMRAERERQGKNSDGERRMGKREDGH